jgi:hypothetical protein
VEAVHCPRLFRDTAIAFIKMWRYEPAKVGGAPVPASVVAMIPMRLLNWLHWGTDAEILVITTYSVRRVSLVEMK